MTYSNIEYGPSAFGRDTANRKFRYAYANGGEAARIYGTSGNYEVKIGNSVRSSEMMRVGKHLGFANTLAECSRILESFQP